MKVDGRFSVKERPQDMENQSIMLNIMTSTGIKIFLLLLYCLLLIACFHLDAQVNAVEFGKNRVQFKKFKWYYYQTKNFNVYYYQNGEELAKFIAQSAEKELPQMEAAAEYSLQRQGQYYFIQ